MSTKPISRARWSRSLGILVAVCVAVGLSAVPGVAAATSGTSVTPLLDCYRENTDGTYTIILGYKNTSTRTTSIPYGNLNVIYPAKFQGLQPTSFLPGTQRGVFSIRASRADLNSNSRWELDGKVLDYRALYNAPVCAPSTPLPALGNGTGLAIALVVGGAFGVFFVRRLVRRAVPAG